MNETFKERVKRFANSQGLSVKALQDELGLSNAHFSNSNSITPRVAKMILAHFPNANIEWLNFGTGDMLIKPAEQVVGEVVPLLPVAAMAGRLTDFTSQVADYECEKIVSPVRGVQIAVPVAGESMSPEYPNGSIALASKIDESSFIEWGKTFVLDTVNGIVIKKVFPNAANNDVVICRSVNVSYGEFEVKKEDIYGWYVVRATLTTR